MLVWLHSAVVINKGGGWVMWQDKCIILEAAKWSVGAKMSPTLENSTLFFSNLEELERTVQVAATEKGSDDVTQLEMLRVTERWNYLYGIPDFLIIRWCRRELFVIYSGNDRNS